VLRHLFGERLRKLFAREADFASRAWAETEFVTGAEDIGTPGTGAQPRRALPLIR